MPCGLCLLSAHGARFAFLFISVNFLLSFLQTSGSFAGSSSIKFRSPSLLSKQSNIQTNKKRFSAVPST